MGEFGSFEYPLADRYRFEKELGSGAMGCVYRATDMRLGRPVAIKVLHATLSNDTGVRRFQSEVRIAANLHHPNIVSVHDSGEVAGRLFYVMDYLAGETLRDRLTREKQLSIDEALSITEQIARGLQFAHDLGIVHRDIKPENILLVDDHVKIVDFGLARAMVDAGERLTATGLSVGTPQYLSPEQASAEKDVGPKADQYALGCVLYEMLVGEPPFTGPTATAVAMRHIVDSPIEPRRRRRTTPVAVDAAIMRALEKVPADRWRSVRDFVHACGASHVPEPAVHGSSTRSYAKRGLIALIGVAALALVIPARIEWNNSHAGEQQIPVRQFPRVTVRYDSTPLLLVVSELARRGSPRAILGPGAESVFVTGSFSNQPVDSVLRAILGASQFNVARDSSTGVLVATLRQKSASTSRDVPRTVLVPVLHRRASELQPLVAFSLSDRGRVIADTLTNSLVITEVSPLVEARVQFANNLDNAAASYKARLVAQSTSPVQAGAVRKPSDAIPVLPARNRHRVLVIGFTNGSVGRLATELSPLRFTIADMVSTELSSDSTLEVVQDFSSINSLDSAAVSAAANAGRRALAESAVIGSYVGDASGRLRISALLVDVNDRKTLHVENIEGNQDTSLVAIQSIAHRIRCDIQTQYGSPCSAAQLARAKPDASTLKLYSSALDAIDAHADSEAIRLLDLVLARYPGFSPAERQLSIVKSRSKP